MFLAIGPARGFVRALWLCAAWGLLSAGVASADVMTLTDGRQFDSVWVDSFTNVNGRGHFMVRTIADGMASAEPNLVEADRVASVHFRQPAASGQPAGGRRGILFMTSGEELPLVWVEQFQRDGAAASFRVRQTAVDAGSSALPLAVANVARVYLGPPDTIPLSDGSQPIGLFSNLQPRRQRPVAPTPVVAQPIYDDGYGDVNVEFDAYDDSYVEEDYSDDYEEYEDDFQWTEADAERWRGGSLNTEGMSDIEVIMAMDKRAELERRNAKRNGGGGYDYSAFSSGSDEDFDAGPLGLSMFGLALGLVSIVISMAATMICGGVMLFMSARAEKINDFPLWKAVITAGMLAIIPLIVFLLCLRFIPWFGLWLGLVGAYFTARAILMGMMEVLEEKATSTLIGFFLIQFAVLVLAAKLL
ncbi:hypothetical protein KQI84_14080 [bacterium]|nr:hypothetical protein [bacterium]